MVAPGDVYEQARQAFANVEAALAMAGAALADVVQTRMYVTDISRWEQVGRAHGEFFAEVRPVTTMVEVAGLVDPQMMIEVEAVAAPPTSRVNALQTRTGRPRSPSAAGCASHDPA